MRRKWHPSTLTVGDPVVASQRFMRDYIGTVARLTEKQILIAGSTMRFWRRNGNEVGGGSYRSAQLLQPTPARVAAVYRADAVRRLQAFPWHACPEATLAEVMRLLPETK